MQQAQLPPGAVGGNVYAQPQAGYPGGAPPLLGYQTAIPGAVAMHEQYFGEGPTLTRCPACHNQTQTVTVGRTGVVTWVSCALICVLGGALGCCFIPFCCRACQDTEHHCTHCGQPIALVKKC